MPRPAGGRAARTDLAGDDADPEPGSWNGSKKEMGGWEGEEPTNQPDQARWLALAGLALAWLGCPSAQAVLFTAVQIYEASSQ